MGFLSHVFNKPVLLSWALPLLVIFACQMGEEEKVDATISFNKIYDSLIQYDSVLITLKDKGGNTIDVVYRGKVDEPGDVENRPAPHWDGGDIIVSIVGYKKDAIVYQTESNFNGATNKKDSVYVYIAPGLGISSLLKDIPMLEGDSIDLPTITVTPVNLKKKDLTWTSSAPDVVRISNTGLKALMAGNAQITVSLATDPTKTIVIAVTVVDPAKIPESLALSDDSLILIAGAVPLRLGLQFVPSTSAKDVIWSIVDTNIATVAADGTVQGKAAGETRLIVASTIKSTVSDTAWVLVTLPKLPEKVVFAKTETEIFEGGAAESLLVSVLPPEASQNVDFTVSDLTLIDLKNGRISGLGQGEGMVIATSKENRLLSDTLVVKVSVKQGVESVTLSKKVLTLFTGGDEPVLTASIAPSTSSQKVQWRADQPGIAKVSDSGKVTGLVPGHTRIHAISLVDSTKQDSADVFVKTDAPVVNIGRTDTIVSVGVSITFLPIVPVQEFGVVVAFRWDVDGTPGWDDTAKAVQAVTVKFDQKKDYTLRFYVRDSEGNETIAIKKVSAIVGPVVLIVTPTDGAYITKPAIKIEWTIDNVIQTTGTDTVLKDGANTIVRSASDAAGKIYSNSITVYLDTVPPVKPIVKGTAGIPSITPIWTWSPGGGGNGTYRIAVDSQVFAGSGFKDTLYIPQTGLTEGVHTLYVQERDAAGNWSLPGKFATMVDLSGPAKPIVRINVTSPSNEKKPKWTWSTGGGGGNGIFQYKFNSSDFSTGTSTPAADTQYVHPNNLGDATYTLYVRERDSLGNWSEPGSAAIVIDTTAPGAPKILATSPTSSAPYWSWSSGGGGSGAYRFKVGGEPSTSSEITVKEYTQPAPLMSKTTYILYIQERDAAGNWSSVANASVFYDLSKPTVTFTAPMAQIPGTFMTKTGTVDLVGTAWSPQGTTGVIKSITYTVDGVAGTLATNLAGDGGWNIKALPLTNNKAIAVKVTAKDIADNTGEATLNILWDNAPPTAPTFTAQPASPLNKTDTRTSLSWTWNQPAGADSFIVKLNGTEVARQVATTYMVNSLTDQTYLIEVQAKDLTGNASSFTPAAGVLVDRINPTAPDLSQPASPRNAAAWTWTGGGGGNGVFKCSLDGAAEFTCNSPYNLNPTEGDHTLRVRESDAAGNMSAYASTTVNIDRTNPLIAISNYTNVMERVFNTLRPFTGTASDERGLKKVTYRVDDTGTVKLAGGTNSWSFSLPNSLKDGTYILTIVATDNADNSDSLKLTITYMKKVKFVREGATGSGTSWSDAVGELWPLLEPGLNYTSEDQVWVAKGTYAPNPVHGVFYSPFNLGIYGGFSNLGTDFSVNSRTITSNPTILFEGSSNSIIQNCYYSEAESGCRDNFTWDGFSITSLPSGNIIDIRNDGATIALSGIAINNFSIVNTSSRVGADDLFSFSGAHVTMKNIQIKRNYLGTSLWGISIDGSAIHSSLTCDGCHFNENYSDGSVGVFLYIGDATVDFKNSTITKNILNSQTLKTPSDVRLSNDLAILKYEKNTTTIDRIDNNGGTITEY